MVEQSLASGIGHIGSALSIADIVAVLWSAVLHDAAPRKLPDRDRFLLCKGHAALALGHCMERADGRGDLRHLLPGRLRPGAHPEHTVPGIDLSTGSLGQGLSVGCGMAFGLRHQGSPARVYVLMSDAECNEGQVWEAAQFAGHHCLGNLTGILDWNGTQALGRTRDVLDLDPVADKWRAFGWEAIEADGHDPADLLRAEAGTLGGQAENDCGPDRPGQGGGFHGGPGPLALPEPDGGDAGRGFGRAGGVLMRTTFVQTLLEMAQEDRPSPPAHRRPWLEGARAVRRGLPRPLP